MSWSKRRLEVALWVLALISLGTVIAIQEFQQLRTGWPFGLLFVLFLVTRVPAAMLSLHLHSPKFFKYLERRR